MAQRFDKGGTLYQVVSQSRTVAGTYFLSLENRPLAAETVLVWIVEIRMTLSAAGEIRVVTVQTGNVDGGAGIITPVNMERGDASGSACVSAQGSSATTAISVTDPGGEGALLMVEDERVLADDTHVFRYPSGPDDEESFVLNEGRALVLYGGAGNAFGRIRYRERRG